MDMTSNVHTHTTWCDGKNTVREMADAAIALGFTDLGFSSHAPAPFDETCLGIQDEAAYRADIAAAKEEYAGRLGILCGIEQDAARPINAKLYDYVIGSVHYLPGTGGQYNAADGDEENLLRARSQWYAGNGEAMAQAFFEATAQSVRHLHPTIVGHFDVIAKYNKRGNLFDEDGARYKNAALAAMDEVITATKDYGGMIEVNTGAMARGLRDVPYPAPFLLRHMAQRGARVIITTDCHRTTMLNAGFHRAVAFLQLAGFVRMCVLRGGRFIDVDLERI